MRWVLGLLSLWMTIVVYGIASEYDLPGQFPIVYLIVLCLMFLSTFVHEAGHAFAARKLGYRIHRFAAMPFEYDLTKRRFGWARVPRKSDVAGYVIVSYPGKEPPQKKALLAFAGPAAEFILAGLIFGSLALAAIPSAEPAQEVPVVVVAGTPPREAAPAMLPQSFEDSADRFFREQRAERRAEIVTGLANMLAALALGGGLINLLPFGGSDGQAIFRSIRALIRNRPS